MSKSLLAGVVAAALATAGVMYANRPGDEPNPAQPPKPQAVVDPVAIAAPQPKGEEKGPDYTTNPKLRRAIDLPVMKSRKVAWSPDGKWLAVDGEEPHGRMTLAGQIIRPIVRLVNFESTMEGEQFLQQSTSLVSFTPDSKYLVTELREYGLVSGRHELDFREIKDSGTVLNGMRQMRFELVRSVSLEPERTSDGVFAANGKVFRTIRQEVSDDLRTYKRVEVVEVDAEKGTTRRSMLTVDGSFRAFDLGHEGRVLVLLDMDDNVLLYDVDGGKKLWSTPAKLERSDVKSGVHPDISARGSIAISPDGRRVVISRGVGTPLVFEAANGRLLPTLEGNGMLVSIVTLGSFSSDGRLLCLPGDRGVVGDPRGLGRAEVNFRRYLAVWDTETGRLVKSWNGGAVAVAFHPSKPILAILEKNGDDRTRLGLWDFSAEAAKKK